MKKNVPAVRLMLVPVPGLRPSCIRRNERAALSALGVSLLLHLSFLHFLGESRLDSPDSIRFSQDYAPVMEVSFSTAPPASEESVAARQSPPKAKPKPRTPLPINPITVEVLFPDIAIKPPLPSIDPISFTTEIREVEPLEFEPSLDLRPENVEKAATEANHLASVASQESETSGENRDARESSDSSGEASKTTSASLLKKVPPTYPAAAVEKELEGKVTLLVQIDESGKPGTIRVIESSGHSLLDTAATDAVENWKFSPARSRGTSILSWVKIPIAFRLSETKN